MAGEYKGGAGEYRVVCAQDSTNHSGGYKQPQRNWW